VAIGVASILALRYWPARTAILHGDDGDIYEAVFRYECEKSDPDAPDSVDVFFFIERKDPPPELLARLSKDFSGVRRGSAYKADSGLHFIAGPIDRMDLEHALVKAGYVVASYGPERGNRIIPPFPEYCSSWQAYRLGLSMGRWRVVEVTTLWTN
jgi:hypothetical protein